MPARGKFIPSNTDPRTVGNVYCISLRNSQYRRKNDAEIRQINRQIKKYKTDVENQNAKYETQKFENRQLGKKEPPAPKPIPIPDGIDVDMLRDFEERPRPHTTISKTRISNPDMIRHCACCNPTPDEVYNPPEYKIKLPRGSCHWQLLDEPEYPSKPETVIHMKKMPKPFYLPARHIGVDSRINLIADNLKKDAEDQQGLIDLRISRQIQRETQATKNELHQRSISSMDRTRQFKSRMSSLAEKSGQMKVAAKLARAKMKKEQVKPEAPSPRDLEAVAELKRFDEALWAERQRQRKSSALASILPIDSPVIRSIMTSQSSI